jgi:hypothetical protein
MRRLSLLVILIGVGNTGGTAWGADLTKIDRTIAKQPVYKNKPAYCLLVFGAEAKPRVWLVLDDDVLYVDRNGNGDLTEDGKRVTFARKRKPDTVSRIDAGKITAKGVPENTCVRLALSDEMTSITSSSEGGLSQCAGDDVRGGLQLGDQPQTAPIVHFYGPLVLQPDRRHTLARIGEPTQLWTHLGTPGLGAGTFAWQGYEKVPKGVHPVAEFEFPAAAAKGPIKAKLVLDHRC